MNARRKLGSDGEDVACLHLEEQGYEVLERNYRCEGGEIDIVAVREGIVVFCEVKTRRTGRWGEPSEAVDFQKRARIRRLGAHWLLDRGARPSSVRFDVISLVMDDRGRQLQHYEDAF